MHFSQWLGQILMSFAKTAPVIMTDNKMSFGSRKE